MIEFETILILMIVGFASLIFTLFLCLTGKKVSKTKKSRQEILRVKILNFRIKLIPFIYFLMVFILFFIGIFSNFIFNSIVGLIVALIPIMSYLIFDRKKDTISEK